MGTSHSSQPQVGLWLVDEEALRLRKQGKEVKIEPKLMRLLLELAAGPGEVQGREDLIDRVWPETSATDDTLNNAIRKLRKVLVADECCVQYIETIPKRGYRLNAPVHFTEPQKIANAHVKADEPNKRYTRSALIAAIFVCGFALYSLFQENPGSPGYTASSTLNQPVKEIALSHHQEAEIFPSLSASAEQVVFVRIAPTMDFNQLIVKRIGESEERNLTGKSGFYSNPVWSPDEQHIAYIELNTLGCNVMLIAVSGGPSEAISPCSAKLVSSFRPVLAWTPDGHHLLVPMQLEGEVTDALFRVNIHSREIEQFTFPPQGSAGDASPVFYPDGGKLAFTRTTAYNTDHFVVAELSENQLHLNEHSLDIFDQHDAPTLGIAWLNENQLVFSSAKRNLYEIWRLDLRDGSTQLLGTGGNNMIHPRFNMLKHSLVMAELNANANIVVRKKELHGFEPKHEISSSKWERGGRISHDKKYVAYIRLVPGGSELWLHEFSTGDDQRIVISHDYIVSVA